MKSSTVPLLSAAMTLVAAHIASSQVAPEPPAAEGRAATMTRAWQEDIRFVGDELPRRHPDLFHTITEQQWTDAVESLIERTPELDDARLYMELIRLVALAGDSHTSVGRPPASIALNQLPVVPAWFDDGIYIVAATAEHTELLGARILAVGTTPIDDAMHRLAGFVAHENDSTLRNAAPQYLRIINALHSAGLCDSDDMASIRAQLADGTTKTVTLTPHPSDAPWKSLPELDPGKTPISLTRRNAHYWFRDIPEHHAIYLAYNQCAEAPDLPMEKFVDALDRAINKLNPDKLIIDLRNNGGGNSAILRPLILYLADHPALNDPDRLFVLIGRRTFSSAQMNALELDQQTNATLVGEPTGGKPNHFGEVRSFTLPNSGILIQHSTKFWKRIDGDPPSTMPDIAVPVLASDYFAGIDRALDIILERPVPGR